LDIVASGTRNARDLSGRQPRDRAQGQRNPGIEREGRVATGMNQPQPVVVGRRMTVGLVCQTFELSEDGKFTDRLLLAGGAPYAIDGPVLGHGG